MTFSLCILNYQSKRMNIMRNLQALEMVVNRELNLKSIHLSEIRIKSFNLRKNIVWVFDKIGYSMYSSPIFKTNGKINDWILALTHTILTKHVKNSGYLSNRQVINILSNNINENLTLHDNNIEFEVLIDKSRKEVYSLISKQFKRVQKIDLHNWIIDNFQDKHGIESFKSLVYDFDNRPIAEYDLPNGIKFEISFGLDTGWSKYLFGKKLGNEFICFNEWKHNYSIEFLLKRITNCFNFAK